MSISVPRINLCYEINRNEMLWDIIHAFNSHLMDQNLLKFSVILLSYTWRQSEVLFLLLEVSVSGS